MGNKAEALTYYNKVIDVNPFSMVAFQERGPLRMELGDEQGGREDIEMAEKMAAQLAADQAQGVADEDVEQKVKQAYKNVDAYGVFSNSWYLVFKSIKNVSYFNDSLAKCLLVTNKSSTFVIELGNMRKMLNQLHTSYYYFYFYFANTCEAEVCVP